MKLLAWLSSGDPQGLKGWRGSIIINTGYSTTHYGCNRASYEVFLPPLGGGAGAHCRILIENERYFTANSID